MSDSFTPLGPLRKRYDGTTGALEAIVDKDNNEVVVASEVLASPGGAGGVGATDGASGTLWTTVQGAITWLKANGGQFIQSIAGAIARTFLSKARDIVHAADFGIVSDNTTDQTAEINAVTATLGGIGFRGQLVIPAGTRFNPVSVFAACPLGVGLNITDTRNWGQYPSYKNKFQTLYYGDSVSDDSVSVIASGHHPAFMTLNMGTAGSGAAAGRYGTWLHGVGKDYDGDPILGWLQQFAKDPSFPKWRASWRLQTPYTVALSNNGAGPTPWTALQVVAANAYRTSDSGKVYTTTVGGTCGSTAPTGTGTGINDGGVLWNYVQAAVNIDRTVMDLDETGNFGTYGPATTVTTTQQSGGRQHSFSIDGTTNNITWQDISRGLQIFQISDAAGLRSGTAMSLNRLAMTGATPNAPSTGAGAVTNGGATNMTSMTKPAGRTNMIVSLRFDDANTTLVHGSGTNEFRLKGGINVNPPVASYITLELDTGFSSVWIETGRSF